MGNEQNLSAEVSAAVSLDAMLTELEDLQRAKAAAEAYEARLLAKLAAWRPAAGATVRDRWAHDTWMRDEVAAALRIAPQTAAGRMARATTLVDELPRTLAALEAGVITGGHAAAVLDAVFPLDAQKAAKLERRVLTNADGTSMAEFRARCRRTVLAVDPRGAARRHAEAKRGRDVSFRPGDDDMGALNAQLDQATLAKIRQRIGSMADTIIKANREGGTDDDRSNGAIRADVFADLLTGEGDRLSVPGTGRAVRQTQVTIAFSTLAGLDDLPGTIDGDAAPACLVRALANDPAAWWRPVLVDCDGRLEAVGARSYKPSAALRRQVELHDLTCRFPGCRRRAETCEADHAVPFDHDEPRRGGRTDLANLHALCKLHHRLKHEAGWSILRINGVTHWRSPGGRHHLKINDGYLTTDTEAKINIALDDDGALSCAGSDPPPF